MSQAKKTLKYRRVNVLAPVGRGGVSVARLLNLSRPDRATIRLIKRNDLLLECCFSSMVVFSLSLNSTESFDEISTWTWRIRSSERKNRATMSGSRPRELCSLVRWSMRNLFKTCACQRWISCICRQITRNTGRWWVERLWNFRWRLGVVVEMDDYTESLALYSVLSSYVASTVM